MGKNNSPHSDDLTGRQVALCQEWTRPPGTLTDRRRALCNIRAFEGQEGVLLREKLIREQFVENMMSVLL